MSFSGRSPSLKLVVEDICYRAGVDLLFYDALDRPFGGQLRELPLAGLFDRVLTEESYLVEIVSSGSMGARVTTLRVLGDNVAGSARRAAGAGHRKPFRVPPALIDQAFGFNGGSVDERNAALATLAKRISGDSRQLEGFLATDPQLIAGALRRYKEVEAPLRELQKQYSDARISEKIDEVIEILSAKPASSH